MHKGSAEQLVAKAGIVFLLGKKALAFPVTAVAQGAKGEQTQLVLW